MAAANSPSVSAPFWCSATKASSSDAMPARSIGSCSAGASIDTNAGMGDFASAEMFLDSSLQGKPATLQPYTCCNDTDYDGGLNRYASDRVMVAGGLEIDALEGGSVAPGGPLPDDLSYTCHAAEEHAPIRAHISTK